ncbi:MAG: hypothetical protein RR469_06320, partial [Erysipelotrichaceae bacterium]
AQAIDLDKNDKLGIGSQIAYDMIRKEVPFFKEDEVFYPYIHKLTTMIENNTMVEAVKKTVKLQEV